MIKYKCMGNRVGKRHQYGGGASLNGKLKIYVHLPVPVFRKGRGNAA